MLDFELTLRYERGGALGYCPAITHHHPRPHLSDSMRHPHVRYTISNALVGYFAHLLPSLPIPRLLCATPKAPSKQPPSLPTIASVLKVAK